MTSSPVTPESPWRRRGNAAPWRQWAAEASDAAICICFSYEAQEEEGVCSLELRRPALFLDLCTWKQTSRFHSTKLDTHWNKIIKNTILNVISKTLVASKCLQMTHYFHNLLCSCHFDEVGATFPRTPFHFKLHRMNFLDVINVKVSLWIKITAAAAEKHFTYYIEWNKLHWIRPDFLEFLVSVKPNMWDKGSNERCLKQRHVTVPP